MSDSKKKQISASILLETFVAVYNEYGEDATLQEVADRLGMNLDNVYQRILQIRAKFRKNGYTLPVMKRTNDPRKTGRKDGARMEVLLEIAKALSFPPASETV